MSQAPAVALSTAVGYCFGTSVAFVGSLYMLVPPHVRTLDRSHPRQIKWRTFATGMVCLGAWAGKQYLLGDGVETAQIPLSVIEMVSANLIPNTSHNLIASGKVLAHVMALYIGPIAQGAVLVAAYMRRENTFSVWEFIKSLYGSILRLLIELEINIII